MPYREVNLGVLLHSEAGACWFVIVVDLFIIRNEYQVGVGAGRWFIAPSSGAATCS